MTSPASDLLDRTTRAIKYTLDLHRAADYAELLASLPMMPDESDRADLALDARVAHLEALTYSASHTYSLCVQTCATVDEAGKLYRRDDIQDELRRRAMRVCLNVFLTDREQQELR